MAAIIMQGGVKKQATIAYFMHYFAQAVPDIKQKRAPKGARVLFRCRIAFKIWQCSI